MHIVTAFEINYYLQNFESRIGGNSRWSRDLTHDFLLFNPLPVDLAMASKQTLFIPAFSAHKRAPTDRGLIMIFKKANDFYTHVRCEDFEPPWWSIILSCVLKTKGHPFLIDLPSSYRSPRKFYDLRFQCTIFLSCVELKSCSANRGNDMTLLSRVTGAMWKYNITVAVQLLRQFQILQNKSGTTLIQVSSSLIIIIMIHITLTLSPRFFSTSYGNQSVAKIWLKINRRLLKVWLKMRSIMFN